MKIQSVIVAAVLACGCTSLTNTTKEKAVNTGGRMYGVRIDTAANTSGSIAPSVVFGSAEWNYLSLPADTKNAQIIVDSQEAGWFTNSIRARRRCTIVISESPLVQDIPVPDLTEEQK